MPVRNRKNRRSPSAGLDAWETVFSSEFDFFGDLRDAGIETDAYGRQDREEARQAWQRFGGEFLSTFRESHQPWALEQFGDPPCR
jgi:hypothetical protein